MRAAKSAAVECSWVVCEVVVEKVSLKPRPGMLGMTRWKAGAEGLVGCVRGLYKDARESGVRGKGGIRRRGVACVYGERRWMKWIRSDVEGVLVEGRERAVRNCGSSLLRYVSLARQLYCSSLYSSLVAPRKT
jgi:hypothetical protein